MYNKIIIVKVVDTLQSVIEKLDTSLNENSSTWYSINNEDRPTAEQNEHLKAPVVFVVYKYNNLPTPNAVKALYMGWGEIRQNEVRWIIDYRIIMKKTSALILHNFLSNSELDLKNDFDTHCYVHIETAPELIEQVCFLLNQPWIPQSTPVDQQNYPVLDTENGLHPFSQRNEHCIRPVSLRKTSDRPEFQRDYDRIVHARAYRRLVDKAQIFTSSKGDHYRTRMTHTLEVAQIARAIAKKLNLNVDLTEAIALAHDLGHTPFGHQGERTLDVILKDDSVIRGIQPGKNLFGGFKHNFQGVRAAAYLEEKYVEFDGLDLTYQVLEGILKHTKMPLWDCESCDKGADGECDQKCFDLGEFLPIGDPAYLFPEYPFATTLEGQIVAVADEIAQRSHDLDDAFAAGILDSTALSNYLSLHKMSSLKEKLERIQTKIEDALKQNRAFVDLDELRHSRIVSVVINFFIEDVAAASRENMEQFSPEDALYVDSHRFSSKLIDFSKRGKILCDYLDKIISKKVISSPEVVRFDNNAAMVVRGLFQAYYNNPRLLHKGTLRKIYIETRKQMDEVIDFANGDLDVVRDEIKKITVMPLAEMEREKQKEYFIKKKILVRCIADFIAGMTDSYAVKEYRSIYTP